MGIEPSNMIEERMPKKGSNLRVLLVGEESAGIQTLKLLANGNYHLIGVMASPARKAIGGLTLWQHAEKFGLRTWPAEMVKDPDFARVLEAEKIDLLLNVHSLFVIKPEIVEVAALGSFNLHPGPLPRYAGLNAPSWAIYQGESVHGVTLHRMLAGIDTGPIAYQSLFDIEESDTGFTLSAKCVRYGMQLIKQLLDTAEADPGAIPEIEQDLSQRNYFRKGTPDDGWLSWLRPAREIFNFVRAADYSPFPSPWINPRSKLGDQEVSFVKTSLTGQTTDSPHGTVDQSEAGIIRVACSDEWLAIKRTMVNGHYVNPMELLAHGDRLES